MKGKRFAFLTALAGLAMLFGGNKASFAQAGAFASAQGCASDTSVTKFVANISVRQSTVLKPCGMVGIQAVNWSAAGQCASISVQTLNNGTQQATVTGLAYFTDAT